MSAISDPLSFRKAVAGASLIGFPLLGLVSSLIDADEGTGMDPAKLYSILAANQRAILVAALIFVASSILVVPAIGGMLHLLHGRRGTALGHVGAAFTLVGAFGHMGYATWQLMLAYVPDAPHETAMIAYLDRSSVVADAVLLPMLLSISVGLVLLALALRRARVIPYWIPLVAVSTVAVEFVLDAIMTDPGKWPPVGIWTLALVAFGAVGIRILRMRRAEWAAHAADDAADDAPARGTMMAAPALRAGHR